MNLILKRLRKKNGESLAETLVALLIAALGLLALAGAINSALNIVENSKRVFANYVQGQKCVVSKNIDDTDVYAIADDGGTLTIGETETEVIIYINSTLGKTDVASFKVKVDQDETGN